MASQESGEACGQGYCLRSTQEDGRNAKSLTFLNMFVLFWIKESENKSCFLGINLFFLAEILSDCNYNLFTREPNKW